MRLSLSHPARLFVDGNTDVASNLRQEFVRIRNIKEEDREAIVTGVCVCCCVCVLLLCVCVCVCVTGSKFDDLYQLTE